MATSTKRASPVTPKPAVKKAVATKSKPYLRFYHSVELRARTLALLTKIENAEKATDHSGPLSELVLELTNCGMDQYFLQSLKAAKVNFVVQQSATLGLAGVQKIVGTVVRSVLGRMDDRQLLAICGSLRGFMA